MGTSAHDFSSDVGSKSRGEDLLGKELNNFNTSADEIYAVVSVITFTKTIYIIRNRLTESCTFLCRTCVR